MQDIIEVETSKGNFTTRKAYTDFPDQCGMIVREVHHPSRKPVFYAGRMELRPFLEPVYSKSIGSAACVTHHVEREDIQHFMAYGAGDSRERALFNASNALILKDIKKG